MSSGADALIGTMVVCVPLMVLSLRGVRREIHRARQHSCIGVLLGCSSSSCDR